MESSSGTGSLRTGGGTGVGLGGPVAGALFRHIVKKGLQGVEIALSEGVILVVVAATAVERLTEPDRSGCFHAIGGVFSEELLRNDAAFLVDHVVAIEAGGDSLRDSRVWQ